MLSGPYSRAYTMDTMAQASSASSLLWFVLGDGAHPSPMALFDDSLNMVLHHRGDLPFNIVQQCWYAAGSYHVPLAAQTMFVERTYPFRVAASSEQGDASLDFPARVSRVETVLHRDFALGTASTPFCGGEQTMSYFVTYKRRDPVTSFRDVGTVYHKLVVDDEVPGTVESAEGTRIIDGQSVKVAYSNSGETDCLVSHANTFTLQDKATALVLNHPHLAMGGDAETGARAKTLSALSEMVIFPSHFGGAEEVLVGGVPRAEWSGEVQRGQWIACRRGRLYVAIRPMAYSRTLGPVRLTLEQVNRYDFIRFGLCRGEPRTFSRT